MRKRTTAIAINSFQITTQCDFKQFSEGHIHLMQVFYVCIYLYTAIFHGSFSIQSINNLTEYE